MLADSLSPEGCAGAAPTIDKPFKPSQTSSIQRLGKIATIRFMNSVSENPSPLTQGPKIVP
jgi:hypothetical protein